MENHSQNKLVYSSGSNRSVQKPLNATGSHTQAQPTKDFHKSDKPLNIGDRVAHLENNQPNYGVIKSMHPTSDKSTLVGVEFVSKEMYVILYYYHFRKAGDFY